ncbi:MAG: hypothetical protein H8E40_12855 [Chloroflexi bacterium]|nr:hypothetical protein [Chloroflexota bacterium]
MRRLKSGVGLIIAILVLALSPGYPGQQAAADGSHLILLWDGASIPAGWTCISDGAGEDFYNRFPRGSGNW